MKLPYITLLGNHETSIMYAPGDSNYNVSKGNLFYGKLELTSPAGALAKNSKIFTIGKIWAIVNDELEGIDVVGPAEDLETFLILYNDLKEQDMTINAKIALVEACCIMVEELKS